MTLNVSFLEALPARLEDLGIINPMSHSFTEYSTLVKISSLRDLILGTMSTLMKAKNEVHKQRKQLLSATKLRVKLSSSSLQCARDLAQEKGASSWLPICNHFKKMQINSLTFRVVLALRYGWQPSLSPTDCACGTNFHY